MYEESCKIIFQMLSSLTAGFAAVFDTILSISIPDPVIDGITALGVSLTSLFFCMEMISQLSQFRVERIEDAIRIGMKFIIAKVIIENTSEIAGGIKAIFTKTSSGSFSEALGSIAIDMPNSIFNDFDAGIFNVNYMILSQFSLLILIMFFVVYVTILISIVGIIFEIAIHQAIAPVALSTLCNDMVRQTGITFIKSYAAVCLQIGVIGIVLKSFSIITPKLTSLNTTINLAAGSPIIGTLSASIMPLLCLIVMSKAVKSSSEITKRMLGA